VAGSKGFWIYVVAFLMGIAIGFIAVKLITCFYIVLGAICGGALGFSLKIAVNKSINFFLINVRAEQLPRVYNEVLSSS
jgi:hypothetical protein